MKAFDDENMSFLCKFILPDTQMLRQLTLLDNKSNLPHVSGSKETIRAHNEKTQTV